MAIWSDEWAQSKMRGHVKDAEERLFIKVADRAAHQGWSDANVVQLLELIGSDDAASSKPYVSGVRYEPFGKNIAWRSRAESGQADPDALTVMSAASAAAQPPDLQVKWSPPEPSPVYPDGV